MGNWEFYDEHEEVENSEEREPSFSFYDFKKWLGSKESLELKPLKENAKQRPMLSEKEKNELKESLKKEVKEKIKRNVDKKLAERKKKA